MTEHGPASPSMLADALGEPLGNVSYHVRVLRELDCLELVRTEPRRGALEHFFRAKTGPWLDDEQWGRMPATVRRRSLLGSLTQIFERAATASRAGGLDGPEAQVSRVALTLDAEGSRQITALLATTLEATRRIDAESATRQAESEPDAPPTIPTELAIMHFRSADSAAPPTPQDRPPA